MTVGVVAIEALGTRETSRAAAFEALYVELYPRLAGFCYGLTGDTQVAQEVAQEAFARLFSKVGTVRQPRAWLHLVATNLCRDTWRRQERDRSLVERAAQVWVHETPAHDSSVRDLVERLPERLRSVVLLHYYADLPVAEVAIVLHRPVGTIKRRLLEARAVLAESARSAT